MLIFSFRIALVVAVSAFASLITAQAINSWIDWAANPMFFWLFNTIKDYFLITLGIYNVLFCVVGQIFWITTNTPNPPIANPSHTGSDFFDCACCKPTV